MLAWMAGAEIASGLVGRAAAALSRAAHLAPAAAPPGVDTGRFPRYFNGDSENEGRHLIEVAVRARPGMPVRVPSLSRAVESGASRRLAAALTVAGVVGCGGSPPRHGPPGFRVCDVGADYLLGVATDEPGVEGIRL